MPLIPPRKIWARNLVHVKQFTFCNSVMIMSWSSCFQSLFVGLWQGLRVPRKQDRYSSWFTIARAKYLVMLLCTHLTFYFSSFASDLLWWKWFVKCESLHFCRYTFQIPDCLMTIWIIGLWWHPVFLQFEKLKYKFPQEQMLALNIHKKKKM